MYDMQKVILDKASCTAVEGAALKLSSSLQGTEKPSLLVADADMFHGDELLQEAAPTPRSKMP